MNTNELGRFAAAALLAWGPLVVVACGGGNAAGPEDYAAQEAPANDTAEATADTGGPCELLTDDEVADALGTDVLSKERNDMQLDTCAWTVKSPEDSAQAAIGIDETELQLVLMPEREYRTRIDHPDLYKPVDGVGDEAYFAYAGGAGGVPGMAQLYVLDGDEAFLLIPGSSFWNDRDRALAALTGLAEEVLERS